MNAEEFRNLLWDLYACPDGLAWAKGKTLEEAWNTLYQVDWMRWLLGRMAGKPGWPDEVVAREVLEQTAGKPAQDADVCNLIRKRIPTVYKGAKQ